MTMRDNRSERKPGIHLASLDFRNHIRLIILSYLLRLVGAVIFGVLFFQLVQRLRPGEALSLTALITIGIDSVPAIASILLVVVTVFLRRHWTAWHRRRARDGSPITMTSCWQTDR